MSSQTIFITAGATSQTRDISLVQNAGATSPGNPLAGLAYNSSGLVAYYRKGATGALTSITLATQTVTGAYSSGGFVEISSANAPGQYRLDIPNAVVDTAGYSSITLSGHADLAAHTIHIVVTAVDFYDAVRMGLTSLPNAAAAASGGLFTRGTGAGQINQDANGRIDVNVAAISTDSAAADNLEAAADGTGYNLGGGSVVAASVTGNVGGTVNGLTSTAQGNVRTAIGMATASFDSDIAATYGAADTASTATLTLAADIGTNGAGLTALPWNAAWDTEVQSECADAITAAALATAAALSTVATYIDTEVAAILAAVDTEIAAIKAKTDSLTFTVANQLDSNAVAIAGAALSGNGPFPHLGIVDIGTAQSYDGATDKLRLRSGFSSPDIVGCWVWVYSSTNGLHTRGIVTAWDNTNKDATIDTPVQDPSGTILYVIVASPAASATSLLPVDVKKINAVTVVGAGTSGDKWRA